MTRPTSRLSKASSALPTSPASNAQKPIALRLFVTRARWVSVVPTAETVLGVPIVHRTRLVGRRMDVAKRGHPVPGGTRVDHIPIGEQAVFRRSR